MYKSDYLGAKWCPIEINYYPGGEPLITMPGAFPVGELLLRPTSLESFCAAMFLVDALTMRGNAPITLHLPYVPGARQDRLNDAGDALFTLKSIANMINARNFSEVIVADPHSDVATALINNVWVKTPREIIRKHLCNSGSINYKWDAVVAPDAGAAKRAGDVAQLLRLPVLQAWKCREIETGKISGFGMQLPLGKVKHVLVVDDICDGGGTFMGLSSVLSDIALTADLFVTHGIFSHGLTDLLGSYREIFTTDSILEKNFALNPDQSAHFHILKEYDV